MFLLNCHGAVPKLDRSENRQPRNVHDDVGSLVRGILLHTHTKIYIYIVYHERKTKWRGELYFIYFISRRKKNTRVKSEAFTKEKKIYSNIGAFLVVYTVRIYTIELIGRPQIFLR